MKKQITIYVEWWNESAEDLPISHEELQQKGLDRAVEMIDDGYTSGELYVDEEGVTLKGWWSVEFKDVSPPIPIPDNHILVGEIENPNRISHLALRGLTRGGNLKGLYLLPKGCIKSVYCLDIKRGDTVIETLTYSSEAKYNHDIAIFT